MQAGYPLTEDMNGFQQEGGGRMDATIHKGQRWVGASPTTTLIISKDKSDIREGPTTADLQVERGQRLPEAGSLQAQHHHYGECREHY